MAKYLLSFLIPLAVLAGVLGAGFVALDDQVHVTENPLMSGPAGPALRQIWSEPYEKLYVPVAYTAWRGIAAVAGGSPWPFHLANWFLHGVNGLLVLLILRRLGLADLPALAGALVFALHPLQVEPVAWVSGLRDVLAGTLSLLAILAYLRRTWPALAGAAALLLLATLAKPAAVAVPFVTAALDVLVVRRPVRAAAAASLALAAVCLPALLLTGAQQDPAVMHLTAPLWARPFVAADALWFYLVRLAVPLRLTPDYARGLADVLADPGIYRHWLGPAALAAGLWLRRGLRPYLGAYAVFVAGLLPVLGFVPFYYQEISTVADRYVYLAMLGPALAAALAVTWLAGRVAAQPRRHLPAVAVAVALLPFAGLSALQASRWHDSIRLFSYAVEIRPRSWLMHFCLGAALVPAGRLDEATRELETTTALRPFFPDAHYNLGEVSLLKGDPAAAVRHFQDALGHDPKRADLRDRLTAVQLAFAQDLVAKGRFAEAGAQYQDLRALLPGVPEIHADYAAMLIRTKRFADAEVELRAALAAKPAMAEAHSNLGIVLFNSGRRPEGLAELTEALRLKPDLEPARQFLVYARTAP